MKTLLASLLVLALTAVIGCSDSPSAIDDNDDDNNIDTNDVALPTVTPFSDTTVLGGMNSSGFFDVKGLDTIAVDSMLVFNIAGLSFADFYEAGPFGDSVDHTVITLNMRTTGEIPELSAGDDRLEAKVVIEVPDSTTGTFHWSAAHDSTDFEITFEYGDERVNYTKVLKGSVTLTLNEAVFFGQRAVEGSFSAVLESPTGERIAVHGVFLY